MPTIAIPSTRREVLTPCHAAWSLTRAISPRPSVRVAVADATGTVLNQYGSHRRLKASAPELPWAVYLADSDRRYRLLAFDLDAKTPDGAPAAARDAHTIADILQDAGLSPVTCASGPSGGRHVWAALAEGVDADTVATLARLTRHLCPSLDLAPLTNPATGCVRPPGTPHRAGGESTVLSGDLNALLSPTSTAAQVNDLVEHLATRIDASAPAGPLDAGRPLPLDEHGHPYLPGPRRELPAASAQALQEDAASGNASAVLWRILIGAASARWHHADVAALVNSPGMEHVRTERVSTGSATTRVPHTPQQSAALLARQWAKAATHVATTPRQIGEDPTFDARADAIATHVRDLQSRADSATGRWAHGPGPTDRRVLDVLSTLALQALTTDLEADIRRLGLLAGIGRETARTALHRLATDGWITKIRDAEGSRAATWKLHPTMVIHSSAHQGRSQADPRPAGAGAAERLTLLAYLTTRLRDCTHDLFTPGPGLGHLAGNLYARTEQGPRTLTELSTDLGIPPERTTALLARMTDLGLLLHSPTGWRRPLQDRRSPIAKHLEVDGRLSRRAANYRLERQLWAWWQAETKWMQAPRRTAPSRRPGPGQLVLVPELATNVFGAHPRRPDGQADYRHARQILESGITASQQTRTRLQRGTAATAA